MPIRILHVVTTMDVGGIETFIMNLYRNIDRSKVQFDFLTHRDYEGFYEEEIRKMGGRIYRMIPITPKRMPEYLKKMKKFFKAHPEYKVVHSHINAWSYMVLKCAKSAGVKTRISHAHTSNSVSPGEGVLRLKFKNFCRKHLAKQTTHRFACSEQAGLWLYNGSNDFEIINNGIDTQKFLFDPKKRTEVRNEFNLKHEIVLGHIGRMSDEKNHSFLIEFFDKFHKINNNSKLILIGDGELRSALESKVKKLDLANDVIFTGIRMDANIILQAVDIYLFPSKFEGLPVSLVEAQASGLPCIKSDTITDEVVVTDLVKKLPITNIDPWVDTCSEFSTKFDRRNRYKDIVSFGFDIKSTVSRLEEFYRNEYKK